MKCPFYKSECIKEKCIAYSIKEEYRDIPGLEDGWFSITKFTGPFCSAFNKYITIKGVTK